MTPRYYAILILLVLFGISASGCFAQNRFTHPGFSQFNTDFSTYSIEPSDILPGGPPKDGIPALTDPDFVSITSEYYDPETLGVFINADDERRFYPYNILVWHEIVNDRIGGQELAITFCPLCGSAMVFDRTIDGVTYEFGVSGYLYQSNMLMYDRQTDSFWSQTLGEAVVGELTGTQLDLAMFQLLTFEDVKKRYPDTKILSRDTGHNRNYTRYPYGNYDDNEELFFPVRTVDDRHHPKKMMYIIRVAGRSLAFDPDLAANGAAQKTVDGTDVEIRRDGNELFAAVDGKITPGYWEMWFSWAIHHRETGIVWDAD